MEGFTAKIMMRKFESRSHGEFMKLNHESRSQGAEVPMSLRLPTKLGDVWQGYDSETPESRTGDLYLDPAYLVQRLL